MRAIKFRAHPKGEIGYKSFKCFSLKEIVKHFGFEYGLPENIPMDDGWIFDQFTGLKDKNGKEIYEGDLIKHEDDTFNHIYEVKWVLEEWDEDGFHTGFHRTFTFDQYEIVGNIYENPELLK